jgi:hypothetical protein
MRIFSSPTWYFYTRGEEINAAASSGRKAVLAHTAISLPMKEFFSAAPQVRRRHKFISGLMRRGVCDAAAATASDIKGE